MTKLKEFEEIQGKSFKVCTKNIRGNLDVVSGTKIIYNNSYKSNKKKTFRGIEDEEVMYETNDNKFYLYISVPQDSYLCEMGIRVNDKECIVEMEEDQVIDYLEHRLATATILEYFSDKLMWDNHRISNPSLCYIKNRKVYDINQSASVSLYINEYVNCGIEVCEYEELFLTNAGEFFLYSLYESLRTVNPNLYFRNNAIGWGEEADILVMSEQEAIEWYLFRVGNIEGFLCSLKNAKRNLDIII